MLPGVCDAIPNEPEATDCTVSGGSIRVLTNNRIGVVMFSPFGEASPADPQGYFNAIGQGINLAIGKYIRHIAPGGNAFDCSAFAHRVDGHLSALAGAPRAVAVLPSLSHQQLAVGLASFNGHVYRTGFPLWQIEIKVIVLGAAPP